MSRLLRSIGIFVLCKAAACAAETGSIEGRVVDLIGAAIQAEITLFAAADNARLVESSAEEDGSFKLTSLRPATYRVTVKSPGFKARTFEKVQVRADRSSKLHRIVLAIASCEEQMCCLQVWQ